MQRKDKQKIVDEVWTAERIRSFLDLQRHRHGAAFAEILRAAG